MTSFASLYSSDEMTVVVGDHNISPRKNLKRYNVVRKCKPKTFKNVKMGADIMLLKVKDHLLGCDEMFTRPYKCTFNNYSIIFRSLGKQFWEER